MPITSGFKDTIDNIIYPTDYTRWDDLGNGSGSHFTITAIDTSNNFTFDEENNGYIRINYTDALRLSNRSTWRIDFTIKINSSSTSTTNFQTSHEGVIFASGEGGTLLTDSTRTVDYAGTIDSNRKFKFYYYDGSDLNSITSTATIGVDDFISVSVRYSDSQIKIYIQDVLDSTTTASAGVANSSYNFVIGGNTTGDSSGDYLLGAQIGSFQIRKDTNASSTDKQLVDRDPNAAFSDYNTLYENSGWDVNTLIKFVDVSPPLPRQIKLIPQTWGTWTNWFQNPKSQIEVTTSAITYPTPITGFKNLTIKTTDGFLCAYARGGSSHRRFVTSSSATEKEWSPITSDKSIHALITDLNPLDEVDGGPYGSGLTTTSSTSYSLTLPSAGYITEEQIAESKTLLDDTKVDTYSATCDINQGMRPRGIKQIQYYIDDSIITQELTTDNNSDKRFFMGLPYYELTHSGTVYEGIGYSFNPSNAKSNRFDHDFRLGNNNTKLIKEIDNNSSAGAGIIVTTRDAHGLSDGDKVMMRPGIFRNVSQYPQHAAGTSGVDAFDALRIHSISFAKVRSTTEIELFADSGLTNPINTSSSDFSNLFCPGYIITPNASGEPFIKDLGHKLASWTSPFDDITSISSNADVVQYPASERKGPLIRTFAGNTQFGTPTLRIADDTVIESLDFGTVAQKSIPDGSASDPIEITTFNTGTSGSNIDGARIFVDLDFPTDGTLHITVSDVETEDSTGTVQIRTFFNLNGRRTGGTDDGLAQNLDSASSIQIPISGDSVMDDTDLRSIQLYAALTGINGSGGTNKATWKLHFVSSSDTGEDRIFWAGGMPPGYNKLTAGNKNTNMSSFKELLRQRSNIVYKTTNENSVFTIKGIPIIFHSLLGNTHISTGSGLDIFRVPFADPVTLHYNMHKVDETVDKTAGTTSFFGPDIAPWVRQATQTKDQLRLWDGRRYRCLVSHTSSKEFTTDFNLGRWEFV